jgi:hypothetical protein
MFSKLGVKVFMKPKTYLYSLSMYCGERGISREAWGAKAAGGVFGPICKVFFETIIKSHISIHRTNSVRTENERVLDVHNIYIFMEKNGGIVGKVKKNM